MAIGKTATKRINAVSAKVVKGANKRNDLKKASKK